MLARSPREWGIWRFAEVLPVSGVPRSASGEPVTGGEGDTPLVRAQRLGETLGIDLYLKNEAFNPTGSFKDRVAVMVVAKALEAGAHRLILSSSGNMAGGVASLAAAAGLRVTAVVAPETSVAKVAQIRMYGADVVRVGPTETDRLSLCLEAARRLGWFTATSPLCPYGSYGAKTMAYEEWSQLAARGAVAPDWVVIPVGYGCNFVGHWKGYLDLQEAGFISRLPRLVGVQPEGSPSLVRAWEEGREEGIPGPSDSIAGGISQTLTLNARQCLQAMRQTGGMAIAVSDTEMLDAQRELARLAGVFAEPSAAAALAGVRKLGGRGVFCLHDRVIAVLTGSGLKDTETALQQAGGDAPTIPARVDALLEVVSPD
ncbi:MAG: threonine synthase [Bacillota bacterium]